MTMIWMDHVLAHELYIVVNEFEGYHENEDIILWFIMLFNSTESYICL